MPQTGATRYQKFLKSEKAKTKLKSKKELPKGTNVTKTNFKVKKIILREQLKKYQDYEILNSRKLNLSDLFNRLHHHNVSSRCDAVNGIKEIITSYEDVIENNLMQLIQALTPLIVDIESKVRSETLKTLHLLLSNAPDNKVEPQFDFICTYLRSAMTHINIKIREDSINLLNILLSCIGGIMAKNFHKIVPNFLDMISSVRVDSKPGRTLTVNLDSRIESVKWRINVLHHLHQFLEKYVELNTPKKTVESLDKITHIYDINKVNKFPLFNPKFIKMSNISYFDLSTQVVCNETEEFSKLLETLLPLLFETWIEVCPKSNNDNIETVLPYDAAILLKNIMGLLHTIWKFVQIMQDKHPDSDIMQSFQKQSRMLYAQHIFKSFPYVAHIKSKKSHKSHIVDYFSDTVNDPKMIKENLVVCYLFILLNPNISQRNGHDLGSVIKYIEKIMNENIEDNNVCELISKILDTIFGNEVIGWNRKPELLHSLFKTIITNSNKTEALNEDLFHLISNIALNEKYSYFHTNELLLQWVGVSLPGILLKDTITHKTLNVLRDFAIRNNTVFNSAIQPLLIKIINNLPNIKVIEPSINSQGYIKLFGLLYWISFSDEGISLIEKQIMDNKYTQDNAKCITNVLTVKSQGIFV